MPIRSNAGSSLHAVVRTYVAPFTVKAVTAMKAMTAMKPKKDGGIRMTDFYAEIADVAGVVLGLSIDATVVRTVLGLSMELAAEQVRTHGKFNLADFFAMKLKEKPATRARIGVNPFTRKIGVFKAKPASRTLTVRPRGALKYLVTDDFVKKQNRYGIFIKW